MASIRLPISVTHQTFIEAVAAGDVIGLTGETYRIHIPRKCFTSCSGIAVMGAWGQNLRRQGHGLEFYGDDKTLRYLARMDLFKVLEFPYQENFERHAEGGRFIPLHKVENTKECWKVITRIGDLVLHHFANAREFFPAMEWAVNEVMDNITIHSETPVPGVVCAQFSPERGRVDIGICDMGRGIKASLSERYEMWSHGDAITKALERGVTRNIEVGQGNGLAGTLDIARANEGVFHIWSGDACFKMSQGKEPNFAIIPETRGSGIGLSLDTTKPVTAWRPAPGARRLALARRGLLLRLSCGLSRCESAEGTPCSCRHRTHRLRKPPFPATSRHSSPHSPSPHSCHDAP